MGQTSFNHIYADNFVLQDYLNRIHFSGEVDLSLNGIKQLMQCQLFSVPFEDLDVQAGKPISLDGNDLVDKLVTRKRGGYCYEVNGLFGLALQKIGIEYIFVAARPMITPVENARTHMAIVAAIEDEQYLIDLGFGGNGIREPMKLSNIGSMVKQGPETFSLIQVDDGEYILKGIINDELKDLYSFNLAIQRWIDFKPANYYNSTHPDSFFVQNLVVVLQNPLGKKILFRDSFKSIENGKTESYNFEQSQYESILLREFQLKNT